MVKAAFLTLHHNWPWKRQLPGGKSTFDGVQFFVPVEEADVVFVYDALPEAKLVVRQSIPVVFVASEPANVKRYRSAFLAQFDSVITSDRDTAHRKRIFVQAGLPWHVGVMAAGGGLARAPMIFEELESYQPRKTKLVSVVSSDKTITSDHRARLAFVSKLKSALGDKVDVFGRGIVDFADKRDVLDAYRYHIALENCAIKDYWTEKLADPFLTLTFPIYHGCPNVQDYFPAESLRQINIYEPDIAVEIIKQVINSDLAEQHLEYLVEARYRVMHEHNVFGMLARVAKDILEEKCCVYETVQRSFLAEGHFTPALATINARLITMVEKLPLIDRVRMRLKRERTEFGRFLIGQWRYATDEIFRSHQKWIRQNPLDELRFQYNLPSGANILDVGGYAGDFTARYLELFNANVTVFEPIPGFAFQIKQRFANDSRVRVYEAGLSDKDEMVKFDLDADSSGFFGVSGSQMVQVTLWDVERILSQFGTEEWHLAKLNIEGGEYALLNRLIDTGRIKSIEHIQVQFHLNIPDARKRYKQLAKRLQQTHKVQWRYPFVWESWIRLKR